MAQIRCVVYSPKGIFIWTKTWVLFLEQCFSKWRVTCWNRRKRAATSHHTPAFPRDISPGLAFFLADFLSPSSLFLQDCVLPANHYRMHLSGPLGTREVIWAKSCSAAAGCLMWWDSVLHPSTFTFVPCAIVNGGELRQGSTAAALAPWMSPPSRKAQACGWRKDSSGAGEWEVEMISERKSV